MVSDWKHSGAGSDNQQSWRNWRALFTYREQELGFDPRTPSESPKKEGKVMNIMLAEQAKGKKRERR